MPNKFEGRKDEAFAQAPLDVALPPPPVNPHLHLEKTWTLKERQEIHAYGRQCATAARAPLLDELRSCRERIAELEAGLRISRDASRCLEADRDTLRAELADFRHAAGVAATTVQALRAEVESLRADAEPVIRVVWRAAITAANNVCVQRSDRANAEDAPCERIAEASGCALAIRAWIEPDAHIDELRELIIVARAAHSTSETRRAEDSAPRAEGGIQ